MMIQLQKSIMIVAIIDDLSGLEDKSEKSGNNDCESE